ncbi:winged helix-turn-helix domain-containing protein [Desulfovibrio ferrophilus]|uniref:Regulatory protein IclR n=1 Tax=Desulfovibrio ferrophilus TaxID=241368 RepID=A0A2Z6AXL7_9BACT|nr:winged helix-turn-helix domain-containing protein [Desulfovibrio ferrophilus]BBD07997.1 regulatory protein IclR [Desulfovibrio ferrophilus]
MLQHQGRFLRPSTDNRTLSLLETLSEDSAVSQSALGERTGLSGAMVNKYLRELQHQGLIDKRPLNAKSYEYVLTQAGHSQRRELLGEYCAEIVRSYTALKALIGNKLDSLEKSGKQRLVLWGASETCEVVLSAIQNTGLTVLALVDSAPAKHGTMLAGHAILPPDILSSMHCDAVIITSFGKSDDIHAQLKPLAMAHGLEVVRL